MYIGTQVEARDDDDFRVWAQLGIKHICADPKGDPASWSLDDILRHREKVEGFGLVLDMIQLPMSSRPIEDAPYPDILLAGANRDRQIDKVCQMIENIGKAGIPAAKYNLNLIGIPRTGMERGRGGSLNEAWRWEKADHNATPGLAGQLSEDENWERIDYFLERVIPVAQSSGVRLACHPHDPYTPPGYKGVTRVLGTVEGLKKFVTMRENPYHGLNFCQGSIAEMLDNPREEIDDIIRWFGRREKIFNVHFRNIRGGKLSFMESFPDEGDMDMVQSLKVYREVGYKWMIMPDHVPTIAGRDPVGVAFGYCYGYITALLEAMKSGQL
ncbi:mannonate dehydratase [Izhakiella australiensis]|uniref:Mannonate dehydratase n=1 Tax=Izhakiella australiensis TaxID=1926881 RepID=A0A1S8YTF6_9GAMM|nr:mannonate dehydratase [Izhakiella australiensis]OON42155.1 mannonate dehydratase [Izhakiella australiensis]